MFEALKKFFIALLPFLQKAAEEALDNAGANSQHSEQFQQEESRKDQQSNQPRAKSSAPKPAAPKPAASASSSSADSSGYPGDYRGSIDFEYSPSMDGDADPGEVVWTWVPFEEDHSQGKDRPVILVGRDGEYLLALMMTSKDHNNRDHADSNYLDIGSGPWDPQGRASEVKLNRVIRVIPSQMRREGSIMPQETFRVIERAYTRLHG
ncbi:MAG: type II toxin-antitoxin system PemK/MazF family toxin [Rothia sp. (in: high G+C Gram-positive bacteria)]|uniref:type II toxin-antitoxin system PemK/MazF family toxin n=1 Tax=Rothia sp. (in: high G+C Gram-positive bacteria) TaxID=1885016 RepID=UPI0026E1076A|nr:type II toxin-antitoxin system PemK/MazF family toxin [Rothia sp. (in: high G+C Gram-positive bacteria)]MDO5750597.1 type II toxin-antitoxin system PemK/MazF family toxin [Rothia sp. (in: high G+C Gram-positive bacteria)]